MIATPPEDSSSGLGSATFLHASSSPSEARSNQRLFPSLLSSPSILMWWVVGRKTGFAALCLAVGTQALAPKPHHALVREARTQTPHRRVATREFRRPTQFRETTNTEFREHWSTRHYAGLEL